MAKTREIKGRMKAVANIQRITKTMQMIATARFQAALKRATSSKPYAQQIGELVREVVGALGAGDGKVSHRLLRSDKQANGRELLLVLTSDRGLCGGYNANILRTASNFLKEHTDRDIDIEVVGKKGVGFFKFAGTPIKAHLTQFGDQPEYDDVNALAERYMTAFAPVDKSATPQYDAVRVCYMNFESIARQKPNILTLLPLEQPGADEGGDDAPQTTGSIAQYDFSPDPESLLNHLLPATVKTELFQCFNEATVGEQIARMVAMKAATDAAGKMGKALTRQYNRARQTAITTELTEIIGGTAALE